MDTVRDVIVDLSSKANRTGRYVMDHLEKSGGLPTVVIPLDQNGKPATQGKGCRTVKEYYSAVAWAIDESPKQTFKIVPAALTAPLS